MNDLPDLDLYGHFKLIATVVGGFVVIAVLARASAFGMRSRW